jgi:hypothetical protein
MNAVVKVIEEFPNYTIDIDGNIRNMKRGSKKVLSVVEDKDGYQIVGLYPEGKRKACKIHRLIALAFLPNPENKPQVNHKNSIRNDNRLENLEWCTPAENVRHAANQGRMSRGENNHKTKLTNSEVLVIKKHLTEKLLKITEIANLFGVKPSVISHIKSGITWSHLQETI